ncbi:MAG: tetratricopeptide repeat protein [Gammaproteobacteria bacterium]|jgi:tetratricopeptide (TPR) repeat protein
MITLFTALQRAMGQTGLVALVSIVLVSCAATGGNPVDPAGDNAPPANPAPEPSANDQQAVPAQALSNDLMFDILLGEIAGQRGDMAVAVPHYLQAAQDARDPRVAERAVQIASFAKQYDVARRAAQRWVELEPDNIEARKVLTALALRTGDTDEVIAQTDYLLRMTDDPEEGYHLATAILAREADKRGALEVMDRLVAIHPDNPYAWMARARIAILAGKLGEALDDVGRALQLQPDLPAAVILKAQVLVRMERKAEATRFLERAVSTSPDSAPLRFAYARMLLDAEQLDAAREQFAMVVRIEPDNPDALYSLALLELETRQYKAGRKHLKKLLELGKREQNAYYYLGYAAVELGDVDEALDWYGKIDSGDYWSQAQLHIAKLLVDRGDLDAMHDHMRVLRQKNPENIVEFYLIEGQVLSDAGLYRKAHGLYSSALESFPDNEDLLYARALVSEKLGQISAAERDMRQILINDPDNARTLNALGYTLADRTDRYEEALTYITRAYEQKPDDPAIIDSMGWVQFRLGNLEEARRYLERAWEMTHDSEIGAHLGEVLWVQGDQDAARRIWDESRKAAPDNPVLLEVLNRLNP